MDDVVEMNLSRAVAITDTTNIRTRVRSRVESENRATNPVELMHFNVLVHGTRGKGSHMVDFEDHIVEPGTAVWIRPGQVQQWSPIDDDFDADVLVFDSGVIPDLPLFDRFVGTTAVAHLGDDSDHVKQQMDWLARDLEATQDYATAAAVVSVLLRLFSRHVETDGGAADTPGRRLAAAFLDSVERNIEHRSVAWHAHDLGASTRSVARATSEAFDQSPKEVIDARLVLEARRRLAWSDQDIATIARGLRFSEPSNFTKFFRTRTGLSPSAFRDRVHALESARSAFDLSTSAERSSGAC